MRVIDSHTEGEPTRAIIDGGPPLGEGPLAERLARFAGEFDHLRRRAVNKPRAPDALVGVDLVDVCTAAVENVESYRHAEAASVEVAGLGTVRGDVAWGGNWFFLTATAPCDLVLANLGKLTPAATAIREALAAQAVTGKDGAPIDHIEIFAPSRSNDANSRNFVLCPGGAYDRSPCGTGTSAKLACLSA